MAIKKELKVKSVVERVRQEEATVSTSEKTTTQIELTDFDLAELEEVDKYHKNITGSQKGCGCITIINHEKCGRRVHLANIIWRELGYPQLLQVFFKEKKLLIMAGGERGIAVKFSHTIPFEEAVKNYTGKVVLYATETVQRITKEWQIDFEENCCFTGGVYRKCTINGSPAVVILKEEVSKETVIETTGNVENVED